MQISQKPIYIPIINHEYTPNNNSINIVYKWFQELYGRVKTLSIDTYQCTKEQFFNIIREGTKGYTTICFYLCIHGKQFINKETKEPEEWLMINDETLILDKEFSEFISELKFQNLYMIIESCHGGGLINTIKIDDTIQDMSNVNILIFNICSKEQKCYVQKSTIGSIGIVTCLLYGNKINPLRHPRTALSLVKRIYPHLHTKLTLLNNIS